MHTDCNKIKVCPRSHDSKEKRLEKSEQGSLTLALRMERASTWDPGCPAQRENLCRGTKLEMVNWGDSQ